MIQYNPVPQLDKAEYSIFLPTWNNLPFLKNCISSIERNSKKKPEILIHINEGKDGTLEWVKENGFSYTYSKNNVGVCFALNALRNLVNTDYIVFINDDMQVLPKWDVYLFEEIEKRQDDLFFYSGTMIEPKETGNKCAIAPLDLGTELEGFSEVELIQKSNDIVKEDWSGGTWPPNIVSTRMWDLVGGYSTEFSPGMYSDPDFSMKLWKAGVRDFKGIGKSRAYHFMSKSVGRIKKNDGKTQFLKKWGISSSTFMKGYLKRGEYLQELNEELDPKLKAMITKDKLKLLYKK